MIAEDGTHVLATANGGVPCIAGGLPGHPQPRRRTEARHHQDDDDHDRYERWDTQRDSAPHKLVKRE